jgi:hypothetical protein
VEAAIKLKVDPRKGDQMVRGACELPHGNGKTVRVAVFALGEDAEVARREGGWREGCLGGVDGWHMPACMRVLQQLW